MFIFIYDSQVPASKVNIVCVAGLFFVSVC